MSRHAVAGPDGARRALTLQVTYLVLVAALVVDLLITKPAYTWGSVAVVASGVPFFTLWRRSAGAAAT